MEMEVQVSALKIYTTSTQYYSRKKNTLKEVEAPLLQHKPIIKRAKLWLCEEKKTSWFLFCSNRQIKYTLS